MSNSEEKLSRLNRRKGRKRSDKILNVLIGIVLLAIVIVTTLIFSGGEKEEVNEALTVPKETQKETPDIAEDEEELEDSEGLTEEESLLEGIDVLEEDDAEVEKDDASGIVTYLYSDDKLIEQSIINPSWEPIATEQTGEHVSVYDKKSVDWVEKEQAIAYATGLSADNMITWRIQNGGSPQKSVGIVSSMDKVEKYRVYLEWVDGEGWKPERLDVLKTLNFDY